jgi:hypothetical protein
MRLNLGFGMRDKHSFFLYRMNLGCGIPYQSGLWYAV